MKIKEIKFVPAFDRRHSDPSKNYGIHGVDCIFYYGDPEVGVVQFVLYTNWFLPETEKEFASSDNCMVREHYPFTFLQAPMPADLGYHAAESQYEGHTSCKCHLLSKKECYYDGSVLNAIRVYDILRREGSDGVWKELERYWKEHFGHSCKKAE